MKKFIICLILVLTCSVSFAIGDGGNGPVPNFARVNGSSAEDYKAKTIALGLLTKWQTFEAFSASVASGNTITVPGYVMTANDCCQIYVVQTSASIHAKFWGYNATTVKEQDWASAFSPTKDNAGTINVYIDGGVVTIQNNSSGHRGFKVFVMGFND